MRSIVSLSTKGSLRIMTAHSKTKPRPRTKEPATLLKWVRKRPAFRQVLLLRDRNPRVDEVQRAFNEFLEAKAKENADVDEFNRYMKRFFELLTMIGKGQAFREIELLKDVSPTTVARLARFMEQPNLSLVEEEGSPGLKPPKFDPLPQKVLHDLWRAWYPQLKNPVSGDAPDVLSKDSTGEPMPRKAPPEATPPGRARVRIDRRKGDRHKAPRKGSRHKGLLLGIRVAQELLVGVKKMARERGKPLAYIVRESLQRAVDEHEAASTPGAPERNETEALLTPLRRANSKPQP
jgi:hypothetical protein